MLIPVAGLAVNLVLGLGCLSEITVVYFVAYCVSCILISCSCIAVVVQFLLLHTVVVVGPVVPHLGPGG